MTPRVVRCPTGTRTAREAAAAVSGVSRWFGPSPTPPPRTAREAAAAVSGPAAS